MDNYRRLLDAVTGPGGVKCHCCNNYKGKQRHQLNRMVRRISKRFVDSEIEEGMKEYEDSKGNA